MKQVDFSLEAASDQIFHPKSREYFKEVLSSYLNHNLRSALVMLWSVVICDLLFKLEYLVDMYQDKQAQSILSNVKGLQAANQKSAEWETKLIELVEDKTHLLDLSEVQALEHLREDRNLCAHPVLSVELELHQPTPEVVRAHIRAGLDAVLTKPPFYTRRVFDEMVSDLSEASSALITEERLERYVESRYLARMKPSVVRLVFRSLWKLVFRTSNVLCDANRDINYRTLLVFANRLGTGVDDLVRSEASYYSDISKKAEIVSRLVELIAAHPSLYSLLEPGARIILDHNIEEHDRSRVLAWFTKKDFKAHVDDLRQWLHQDSEHTISPSGLEFLHGLFTEPSDRKILHDLAVECYGTSSSFNAADERFQALVKPYLEDFCAETLVELLDGVEANNQTYTRRRATADHQLVKGVCDKVLGPGFDFGPFEHFRTSLAGG